MNIVNQEYWDNSYSNFNINTIKENNQLSDAIVRFMKNINNKREVFEIGCYPGRMLYKLGKIGFCISGIDTTSQISKLDYFFDKEKIKYGSFIHGKLESLEAEKNYQVVCSFGFIEHFTNWQEIIAKHVLLTEPEGYIILSTPNFDSIYRKYYQLLFDKSNYKQHVAGSMNPYKWADTLSKLNCEIITIEFVGNYYWTDYVHTNIINRFLKRGFEVFGKIGCKIFPRFFCSYSLLIAKKK